MQFELVVEGFGAVEAPRVDQRGNLYFSDIIFNELYKRAPDGTLRCCLAQRGNIGGLVFNQDGRLICSGSGGLVLFDERSGELHPLLTQIDNQPIDVINDIHTDAAGNIYGGTLDYTGLVAGREPQPGMLFRLDPAGVVTVLSRDVRISNGIGFSPDGSLLYHADTAVGIWRYTLDDSGAATHRDLFAAQTGCDGLAVDAEGGVWAACFAPPSVVRFRPDGTLDRRVEFAAKGVLSLCFGGADQRDLYVTTADDFANPATRKGAVYRARSDIAGQPLTPARF
jgi:sugar lactone lactonase YvrE